MRRRSDSAVGPSVACEVFHEFIFEEMAAGRSGGEQVVCRVKYRGKVRRGHAGKECTPRFQARPGTGGVDLLKMSLRGSWCCPQLK